MLNLSKYSRVIFFVLITLTIVLIGVEVLLRLSDPLSAGRFATDRMFLATHYQTDPRGYSLPVGEFSLSEWAVKINSNRTRNVPDTDTSLQPTIVFIGDSITFGVAVNDDQTWVNLLASEFPDIHFVNAGVSGYNSTQVLSSLSLYSGDAYIWLTIANDLEPAKSLILDEPFPVSYLGIYANLALSKFTSDRLDGENESRYQLRTNDPLRYLDEVTEVQMNMPSLTVVSFSDEFGRFLQQNGINVVLIPRYKHRLSPTDGHPSVQGHEEIADAMRPVVENVIAHLN